MAPVAPENHAGSAAENRRDDAHHEGPVEAYNRRDTGHKRKRDCFGYQSKRYCQPRKDICLDPGGATFKQSVLQVTTNCPAKSQQEPGG